MTGPDGFRLTQYSRGGGCVCKIPPGELEETISRLVPNGPGTDLMVGVENGDDGAVVRISPAMCLSSGSRRHRARRGRGAPQGELGERVCPG